MEIPIHGSKGVLRTAEEIRHVHDAEIIRITDQYGSRRKRRLQRSHCDRFGKFRISSQYTIGIDLHRNRTIGFFFYCLFPMLMVIVSSPAFVPFPAFLPHAAMLSAMVAASPAATIFCLICILLYTESTGFPPPRDLRQSVPDPLLLLLRKRQDPLCPP